MIFLYLFFTIPSHRHDSCNKESLLRDPLLTASRALSNIIGTSITNLTYGFHYSSVIRI